MKIYLSSTDSELSPEEHGLNRMEAVSEHFGFKEVDSPPKDGYGISHNIDSWVEDFIPRDIKYNPLDITYIKSDDESKSFWLPTIEYEMLNDFRKMSSDRYNLRLSYINGRISYLGKFGKSNGTMSASNTDYYCMRAEFRSPKERMINYSSPIGEYE